MSKAKKMTDRDKYDVLQKLDYEGGFDYLNGGSSFPEYTDPEFRKLVKQYQNATQALGDFLGELEDYDFDTEEEY